VGQAHASFGPVGRGLRTLAASPWFPAAAAALLATSAAVEVLLWWTPVVGNRVIALLLVVGATVPVAFAQHRLVTSAALVTVSGVLTLATFERVTGAAMAALVAILYLLGRRRPRWTAVLAVVPFVLYAAMVLLSSSGPASDDVSEAVHVGQEGGPDAIVPDIPPDSGVEEPEDSTYSLLLAGLAPVAAGLGAARKTRDEAAERAASRQVVADTLLAHAAQGERARIARDLHDVVAHHISLISVQAETARVATPGMPSEGAQRLQDIGDTARAALTEMRRLLGVLREDASDEPPPREPQPGFSDLVELVDRARELSSSTIRLTVDGAVRPVGPGIGLTVYRVVQEALTNARRHAPTAAVDVRLVWTDDAVRVRVGDTGSGPDAGHVAGQVGHGLLGMQERVASMGGRFAAGPGPIGGFVVEAELPIGATAETGQESKAALPGSTDD
jgi:signal transduction histidine kinase